MAEALEFLQTLVDAGKSYSYVNSARSALSAILIMNNGQQFGEMNLVKQFMKGVYNLRPPNPRYTEVWDPDQVLRLLKKWSPAKSLSLKLLSWKLVMLILLTTGQRGQIITALNVERMEVTASKIVFEIKNSDIKQGRLGYKLRPVCLQSFPADKRLCVRHYMMEYLKKTLEIRGKTKQVFLTTVKPYGPVSRDSVSRWVKEVLKRAGINVKKFKAGSTRSASTSKASTQGAPVDEIMQAAGWSRPTTFSKWYKKPIKSNAKFDDFVLKTVKKS